MYPIIPLPTSRACFLLDEDRIILQSISQFLRRRGYDVKTTDSPESALAQLEFGAIRAAL
jgi:ActR/RegA family two-component response regulator